MVEKDELYRTLVEKLKKDKPEKLIPFIKENFIFLFENADLLIKIEKNIKEFDSNFEIKDPVFKLLKARLFSLKHEHDLVEREFKDLDFNKLPPEFHDFYYYTAALIYFNKKKFNLALRLIDSGLEIGNKKGRKLSKFMDYRFKNLKGIIHFARDDYDGALNYFKQALESAKKVNISKIGQRAAMESIGKVYMIKGDFKKAIDIFEKVIRNYKIKSLDYRIFRKIAVCYLNMGDVERATEYIERATENFESHKGVEYYYIFLYITLSDIFMAMDDMEKAGNYIELMKKVSSDYSFMDVSFNVKLSELKFMIVSRDIKNAFHLSSEMENPSKSIFLAELLLYRAIILFYLSELQKSRFCFENAISVVPPDSFLRDVIWNTYFIYLSRIGEKEEISLNPEKSFISSLFSDINLRKKEVEIFDIVKRVGRVI